ncbi:helix-turn-helix domain-containing protein [Nannocystis pusilla]|uniref:helix-turn-helix domain-containing protein n=1 Tax=Nannocystis pusilla TaxID=889268 RepID=UPI003B825239
MSLKAFRDSVERAFILQRLSEQNWNVSKTAETLDVERTHLHKNETFGDRPRRVTLVACSGRAATLGRMVRPDDAEEHDPEGAARSRHAAPFQRVRVPSG